MRTKHFLDKCIVGLAFIALAFLFSCSKEKELEPVSASLSGTPEITVTTLLSNQGIIWGFDFLPNGNLLFTQKTGTMRLFDTRTQLIHLFQDYRLLLHHQAREAC